MDGAETLDRLLKADTYDLIGVTAFSYSLNNIYRMIARIKASTGAPLVVGGAHVSVSKGAILQTTAADFAIKNEGEYTLQHLLQVLKSPTPDFGSVDGLIWRSGQDIVENKDRELVQNLDALPYPDFESFGIERYPCYRAKAIPLITQRGCPYKCVFCSVPLSMGSPFRARTPENTVAEIEYWYNKGWRHFQINDDVFNIRRQRVMDICRLIEERDLDITWELYNGIRVNVVDEEMLAAMKCAGCRLISFGCESGSPRILKVIKKGLTLDQVQRAVRLTKDAGIASSVNFIVGHPTETYQDGLETVRFAKTLPATYVHFYNSVPYPGTDLFGWVKDNARILAKNYLDDLSFSAGEPIFETEQFTSEQRMKVLKMGQQLDERTVLRFRLGRVLGSIAYGLTRIPPIHAFGQFIVTNTSLGQRIFSWFSVKFGGMVWVR